MVRFSTALLAVISICIQLGVATYANDSIHPIVINGKHFVDSVTSQRFSMRGIDYQPGGSAAYDRRSDPLSDVQQCARDIYLMQQLGVNTVRVYTINPQLNHDECMTMLAAAGIYLVLDINSPLAAESINRYEPWTTYTPEYLRHIFEVVDQFSQYNNTLGYFIGNEIVNDERSANVSPPYIRAVARDVKDYMHYNCPRSIPIGYSAADDLRYRHQLPQYLTCGDQKSTIDFYGVNSYQWCGKQTMQSSGYDILVQDYQTFDFPVFFSEFGCNHIQPRIFQEVEAIFSAEMSDVFDGGLVYEFTQEANDYGLVSIDSSGNARMRDDFVALKNQFQKVLDSFRIGQSATMTITAKSSQPTVYANNSEGMLAGPLVPKDKSTISEASTAVFRNRKLNRVGTDDACLASYSNLPGASRSIPNSFGTDMIRNGVQVIRGKYRASILENMPITNYDIYDNRGVKVPNPQIVIVKGFNADAKISRTYRAKSATSDVIKDSVPTKRLKQKKNKNGATTTFRHRLLAGCFAFSICFFMF